ncbi:MAG: hypothetical protein IK955_07355 [Clostridia bacterium]|nr:hypothetical protein [Clostridia bacterium]
MENLNDIIASLTPDDIQALKETAQSIFGNDNDSSAKSFNNEKKDSSSFGFDFSSMPDPDMFSKIGRIMSLMNSDSGKRCKLIEALKPNLSYEKQKKADEAMQILKLLELVPMISELTKKG